MSASRWVKFSVTGALGLGAIAGAAAMTAAAMELRTDNGTVLDGGGVDATTIQPTPGDGASDAKPANGSTSTKLKPSATPSPSPSAIPTQPPVEPPAPPAPAPAPAPPAPAPAPAPAPPVQVEQPAPVYVEPSSPASVVSAESVD